MFIFDKCVKSSLPLNLLSSWSFYGPASANFTFRTSFIWSFLFVRKRGLGFSRIQRVTEFLIIQLQKKGPNFENPRDSPALISSIQWKFQNNPEIIFLWRPSVFTPSLLSGSIPLLCSDFFNAWCNITDGMKYIYTWLLSLYLRLPLLYHRPSNVFVYFFYSMVYIVFQWSGDVNPWRHLKSVSKKSFVATNVHHSNNNNKINECKIPWVFIWDMDNL